MWRTILLPQRLTQIGHSIFHIGLTASLITLSRCNRPKKSTPNSKHSSRPALPKAPTSQRAGEGLWRHPEQRNDHRPRPRVQLRPHPGGSLRSAQANLPGTRLDFDSCAKRILIPMSSVGAIASVPGELFAKFQTSFYSDPVDAVFKALGVD